MMKKFQELAPKEKIAVMAAAVVAAILIYFGFFLGPTLKKTAQLNKKIAAQKLEWEKLSALVEEHRKIAPLLAKAGNEALMPAIERMMREVGIQNKLPSIRPFGEGGKEAEVKFEDLTGEEIVKFIHGLEKAGISVVHFFGKDYDGNGLWYVKLYLREEGGEG